MGLIGEAPTSENVDPAGERDSVVIPNGVPNQQMYVMMMYQAIADKMSQGTLLVGKLNECF